MTEAGFQCEAATESASRAAGRAANANPGKGAGQPDNAASPLRLLVFGFDAAEAAQRRRIRSYLDCGFDVRAFTMRRANRTAEAAPFWENVHLYETANDAMGQRVSAILGSIAKVRRHREWIAPTDIIVARNLDMLMIAAAAREMIKPRPPLVYECLDIHGMMTAKGPKSAMARALERRLLARTAALIVSSPAFVTEYFWPVQRWEGPTALLENKLWIPGGEPARPDPAVLSAPATRRAQGAEEHIVLGWVGTLRCRQSLALLGAAARAMGPRLTVALHGAVHYNAIPDFDEIVESHPNIIHHGPYEYPGDLAPIYADCDLVWAQDLWQWGTNSTWLLPNRIYEASYFGCPSIAVNGTETGRRVAEGLGWTIPEPCTADLLALLRRLSPSEIDARRRALLAMPEAAFRQDPAEISAAIRLPLTS